ncbi:MAG: ATP-dependent DNA helicase UvrD2 [Schaalia hyovaginalis]|uniref:ATP-dependent helicase n=1 Tax=Schaalia hyovaginalis TaxID=29316 RepID=UPI002A914E33|nr:ATP-dependent DNA helicase UvrD2 [Schaalia hyovaginalis]MDY6213493.1 ATP-dependent DNA helicase UvrD2 [Schaalia hyovaginalis]
MNERDPEALLDALDPDQRAVALQVTGPLAVLAGAGTGKTRAITYRIAYGTAIGAYPPDSVLAVTFTRRAAFEMRHRLAGLGVPRAQARTFHSAALRQLQHFWPTVIGGPMPSILAHKASIVSSAAARLGIIADKTIVRDLSAEVEWAKVSLVDAEHYAERVKAGHEVPAGLSADDMARLLDVYEDAKSERGVIDFEDVLVILCGMLQERSDVAAKVRAQYRHFVVDEFQDVSAIQRRLLDLWLGERHDVCVVGDVAQTIYSFAGADPAHLLDFPRRHRGARVLELRRDYRSTPQIVAVANGLMAHAKETGAVRLQSQRPGGAAVRFTTYASDAEEAEGVAAKAEGLIASGMRPDAIAVLFRTNGQSQAFEEAFAARGIPVALSDGRPFFQREDVRNAMRVLTTAAKFVDPQAPPSLVEAVTAQLEAVGWTPEAPTGGAAQERWGNLRAIVSWAEDSSARDIAEFVAEMEERAQYQVEPDKRGVELTTLHAAKGLEWDAVFLVGAAEGLLPISHAKSPEAREEERRLLYVGITRARDLLEISWAKARGAGSRGARKRSQLLDGIWPDEAVSPRASRRASGREAARDFAARASEEDLALYEELRIWRSATAKAGGRPPFAVFTDQTLREIALSRPTGFEDLLRVKGIGEVKARMFGAHVLAIVAGEQVDVPEAE